MFYDQVQENIKYQKDKINIKNKIDNLKPKSEIKTPFISHKTTT